MMEWQAWFTIGVLCLTLGLLALTRIGADLIMVGALTLVLTAGVLSPAEALAGLANEGVVTVGALFVVVAGLRETGAISMIGQSLLGRPKSALWAQARMTFPVALVSAFLNNTPVVALMLPAVREWAKKNRLSLSKLLIPLSYASILGGTCTLIGTSTNLVVNGLLISLAGHEGLGLFELAWVGVPCALVGLGYLLVCGQRLLPDRIPAVSAHSNPREYTVEMVVEPGSPLAGQSIEQAHLRHLPGLFLIEIDRNGHVLHAVAPTELLRENDRLIFVGVVESVVDLQRMRGLRPATDQVFKLDSPRSHRCLIEAVVSNTCPLVGTTIRDGRFRTVYNAAIIAVGRNGERIDQKIGDIVLRAGDTLLLEAHPWFLEHQHNSRDFFLVSRVEDSTPRRHERIWVAVTILLAMVVVAGTGWLSIVNAAMLAAGLMILSRCLTGTEARRSVDWQVLLVIAASFGLGRALQVSGAASTIASSLIGIASTNPWLALALTYVITMVLTEVLTNNAAAVLIFPIALATAAALGVSFLPFVIAIMIAASCGFATPIGYQTNLMVYGPGGYRFVDFLRIGIPLKLLVGVVAIALIPIVWAF